MNKGNRKIFDKFRNKELFENIENSDWQKMEYKYLPGPNKMLPKVMFAKKNLINNNKNGYFYLPKEISDIREKETFKKGKSFNKKHLTTWIDHCKECIKKYPDWQVFDFKFKESSNYSDVSEFYRDVSKYGYKLSFIDISDNILKKMIAGGEFYLFEIYNKDFSEYRTGKENLHTSYFKYLFNNENLKNPILKLSGGAEVFYREASLDKEIDKKRKTKRQIVKNKRYTEDKYFFHVPICLNMGEKISNKNFNLKINATLVNNIDNVKIIGIDRGEKHLLYYSVIDMKGNIIKTASLNEINGKNYWKLLDEKERQRKEQRLNWQEITKIKEIKQGYISQAVKIIADLAVKYNAIIVLEDLNSGFKRGRQKIEKQVYQNFELALVNKLNYLVDKNKKLIEPGHYLQALQLAPKIDNFKDINKQTGILFYTPAGYTSVTCPNCGFRKNIYIKFEKIDKSKKDLEKIEIKYLPKKDCFSFSYDINNFSKNNKNKSNKNEVFKDISLKDKYLIMSDVSRLRYMRNKDNRSGEIIEYDISNELKKLFENNDIDFIKNNDISKAINDENYPSDFYRSLIFFINLILQLRNSDTSQEKDYISCPCCGFNSDKPSKYLEKISNGDANGAFNIARKGMIILEKLKQKNNELEKISYADLIVYQDEWDKFVQN